MPLQCSLRGTMKGSSSSKAFQPSRGRGDVAAAAREAIARGDREAALRLLHAFAVAGAEPAADLTSGTAEALAATASGQPDAQDRAAVEAYEKAETAYRAIADQIQGTLLTGAHIASLRALLDSRERELDDQLTERRLEVHGAPAASVRIGNGWLELKWIPRKSGKATGPYLYFWTVPFLAV